MLHDLQGLGSLTTIWGHLSDTWDKAKCRSFVGAEFSRDMYIEFLEKDIVLIDCSLY